MTYDFIQLKLENITPEQMEQFKVKVGTNPIWDVPHAGIIHDLNVYYSRKNKVSYLTLWFYRPEMATEEERMMTSLGTLGLSQVTVNWKNNLDAGDPEPAITAYAMRRKGEPLGLMTKIKEFSSANLGSGRVELTKIDKGPRIQAMHLDNPAISEIEVDVNAGLGTGKLIDASKELLETTQEQAVHARTPVSAKFVHVDFNLQGKIIANLKTDQLQDLRIYAKQQAAGTINNYVEYIDALNGI
ncbi:hypothetical protein NBRC116587_19680 [Pseudoteredinibacter isoporae]